jgi:hypothetical protein
MTSVSIRGFLVLIGCVAITTAEITIMQPVLDLPFMGGIAPPLQGSRDLVVDLPEEAPLTPVTLPDLAGTAHKPLPLLPGDKLRVEPNVLGRSTLKQRLEGTMCSWVGGGREDSVLCLVGFREPST